MKNEKITILIPAKNSYSTIKETLDSVEMLNKDLIAEILYIDDASIDGSFEYAKRLVSESEINYKFHQNKVSQGLAKNYNWGIKETKSRYFLTLHQDMEITDTKSLEKTLQVFQKFKNCALVTSDIVHPEELYFKYNFWMKVQFSRIIGRRNDGFSGGKFDCYDLSKIDILFDAECFKTSGEDVAFSFKLQDKDLISAPSGVLIIHNHNLDPNYSLRNYLFKESQMNETYGVLFRKFGFKKNKIKSVILMFHRPILLILLFNPLTKYIGLVLVLFYIFYYSKKVFITEYKDLRIILVPFVNLYLIFLGSFWIISGYVRGKQVL